jgi:DNA-binding NarL/FixJ family response regulator
MTRIAIVAASEELRAALASALRASPAFDIVTTSASVGDASPSADVVLVARPGEATRRVASGVRPATVDSVDASVPALTNREREVLMLLADGLGNKQIAARLGISTNTVKTHLEQLFEKLDVSTRAEAVATAVKRGLLLL